MPDEPRNMLALVHRVAEEFDAEVSVNEATTILWEHTGFPGFFDGDPMTCCRAQLRDFFAHVTDRGRLFRLGSFTLASGEEVGWKIECDGLTKGDWDALATMAVERFGPVNAVIGVPRGGVPFAKALKPLCTYGGANWIVDDVFTTGGSITAFRDDPNFPHRRGHSGVVAFTRGPTPPWVHALFTMGSL